MTGSTVQKPLTRNWTSLRNTTCEKTAEERDIAHAIAKRVFAVTIAETTQQSRISKSVIIHPSVFINMVYRNILSGTRTSPHLQRRISEGELITGTSKTWNQETKETLLPPTSGCTPNCICQLVHEIKIGQMKTREGHVTEADLQGDTIADPREGETAGRGRKRDSRSPR